MTLLTYQVFKTVTEQGSFRKAADLLGLTPSAVSHAVSSLEAELGFCVLNRAKSGVTLTNYGERLLPYVNAVLNSDESLQQAISEFNGLKQGKVKVGCFSSVCTNWIPELIHSFHEEYPDISMEIFQGTYEPLYKDPLLCVVQKGQRTSKEPMSIEEMKNCQFVTQRESTDADIQNFMKENHLDVRSSYHVVDDLSTVVMVANGFGICLMPEMVMKDIPYEVDCFPVKPDACRIIGIAALNPDNMAPAVRTFYNRVLAMYQQEEYVK